MNASSPSPDLSRRDFLSRSLGAIGALAALGTAPSVSAQAPAAPTRKIKLGVIGNGGRGAWIAKLFQAHGGYEMWAVADYFQEVADRCGDALGVDRARRFSTLSGYKRLIESGVEAVAVETPPYFIPEHVTAAVAAGLHVYMAKPVASDVPGALQVAAAGKRATQQKRCFLVDYQLPTEPMNLEVAARIRGGALGKLARVVTAGIGGGCKDQPKTANLESRLQELVWVNDVAMGCDYIGNFDIHALDAALWVLDRRPVACCGASQIMRPNAHGDSRDVCALTYEYADGLIHQHLGQSLKNNSTTELSAAFYGTEANALLTYWGRPFVRGGARHFSGEAIANPYQAGAERNIARFHREIVAERFENDTCQRAVDGALICILGYEAAARRTRLTMDDVVRENKRLPVDLRGLKT